MQPNSQRLLAQLTAAMIGRHPTDAARIRRAATIVAQGGVQFQEDCSARVRASDGLGAYRVTALGCGCADATHRGTTCKHQLAVRLAVGLDDAERFARLSAQRPARARAA